MKGVPHSKDGHSDIDHKLIRRSVRGDLTAFRSLVERHQNYVYSLAYRSLLHKEEAEDVVQETFIKVWLKLSSFDYRGKFSTWVYRIVVNLCFDRLKSKAWMNSHPMASIGNNIHQIKQYDELKQMEYKDLKEHIKMLADHLSPKQRMVFILRDLQDLNIEEVSQVMRMSKGSVKTNLYLARNAIRLNLIKTGEMPNDL